MGVSGGPTDGSDFRVNFLILGTQKGGTTALARFLAPHPEICFAPMKEVHLFDYPGWPWSDWSPEAVNRRYRAYFPNYQGEPIIGEATPEYMYLPWVPGLLHAYNPGLKLVVLLREPGERAVSHFRHEKHRGGARFSFLLELLRERYHLMREWRTGRYPVHLRACAYVDRGRYLPQIRRVLRYFDRSQVLFLLSEDLRDHHERTLKALYRFLRVHPPDILPAPERHNTSPKESGSATAKLLSRGISWALRRDVSQLERLLELDLSTWRKGRRRTRPRPRNDLRAWLADRFARVLGLESVRPRDDFFELGGGIGQAGMLLEATSLHIGRTITFEQLCRFPTAEQLAEGISSGAASRGKAAEKTLFAIGGLDGHGHGLHLLERYIPGFEIHVLRPSAMRWDFVVTLEDMAGHYVERLTDEPPRAAWHLLGEGFGGLLAFEIALKLQERGVDVGLLAMIDPPPPIQSAPPLASLDPPANCGRAMEARERLIRSHLAAWRDYRPRASFDGAIHAFITDSGSGLPLVDRRLDWERFATRGVRIFRTRGRRGSLDLPPRRAVVGRRLRQLIASGEASGLSVRDYQRSASPRIADGNGSILMPTGVLLTTSADSRWGCIEETLLEDGRLTVGGWAVHPEVEEPAREIAVFLNGVLVLHEAMPRTRASKAFEVSAELDPNTPDAPFEIRVFTVGVNAIGELLRAQPRITT